MELAAMSFACRELRNRKYLKINNLNKYIIDVNNKLQALTEAVTRLEQRAGTLPPQTMQAPLSTQAHEHNMHGSSQAIPATAHPEMLQV
jgi:hypothetical protein